MFQSEAGTNKHQDKAGKQKNHYEINEKYIIETNAQPGQPAVGSLCWSQALLFMRYATTDNDYDWGLKG